MTSAARASRERARLIRASEKARRRYWHATIQQARVRARLDELAGELKAAADGLAELETGGEP